MKGTSVHIENMRTKHGFPDAKTFRDLREMGPRYPWRLSGTSLSTGVGPIFVPSATSLDPLLPFADHVTKGNGGSGDENDQVRALTCKKHIRFWNSSTCTHWYFGIFYFRWKLTLCESLYLVSSIYELGLQKISSLKLLSLPQGRG